MEVAGANRRWRCQFRYRGSRHESAVAQLFSLGTLAAMTDSTSSRGLRAALFTLVPAAYLSMRFWRPYNSFGTGFSGTDSFLICGVLMAAVFLVSLLSWSTYRLVAVFGLLACFLWLAVVLLPVL